MESSREVIRNEDGSIPKREDTIELPSTPGQAQTTVYDLEGRKHIMPRLNAHDMVQHLGWFWKLPAAIGGAAAAVERQVVVLVSKKNAPAPDANANEQEKVDLSAMTVDELRAFAKKHFDMDFGPEVDAAHILDAIVTEQEAA
jgi:hypothetical protein